MRIITLRSILKQRLCLIIFFVLCCIFISENTFSRQNWNRNYVNVSYDATVNAIVMRIKFIDYHFGPFNENGYIKWLQFEYSTDGNKYKEFWMVTSRDQGHTGWSWVNMTHKLSNVEAQFNGCYEPEDGTKWPDHQFDNIVKVRDEGNQAFITVKWFLSDPFSDVKYIRIVGEWQVNGFYTYDAINYEVYAINKPSVENENNEIIKDQPVKVSTTIDGNVVVQGAEFGQKIEIYGTSGSLINSIVAKSDVVKIELKANQMYVVKIGQTRYKVTF